MPPRPIVFIGSTGGGVLSRLGRHAFVREMTREAVADRPCGFLDVARGLGMPAVRLDAADGATFSDALQQRYAGQDDLLYLSFYTRLFGGDFLARQQGRLFNCHPSLLPMAPGMHGFEDTLAADCLFMGCTLHAIDAGIDTGAPVIQAALPIDRSRPAADNRHRVFLAQYYTSLQFLRWIHDDRLSFVADGRPAIRDARWQPSPFAPNLDDDFFDLLEAVGETNELEP